jgi:hypothetical protein
LALPPLLLILPGPLFASLRKLINKPPTINYSLY